MSARAWCTLTVVLSALGLLTTACREQVTGPGVCPDFCPPVSVQLIDTTLTGAVEREEWNRGYLSASTSSVMQVVADPTGRNSVGVIRFAAFADSMQSGIGRLVIQSVDSFEFKVTFVRGSQDVADLELVLHRLPVDIDSLTTYADIGPLIDDSTEIATIPVVVSDTTDSLSATVPPTAFPNFVTDSLTVAIGVALRSATGGFVTLASEQASSIQRPTVRRYATVDSAGTSIELSDLSATRFDTFLVPDLPDPGPDIVVVGGLPSARAFARVRLPGRILDSSSVSRATLLLMPSRAALGGPGDTLLLQAFGLTADVGPKSPFFALPLDTAIDRGLARIPVSSSDTVRIDVTLILQAWQNDTTLPRALLLRVAPEAGTVGELWLHTSRSPVGAPALRITYVPTFAAAP